MRASQSQMLPHCDAAGHRRRGTEEDLTIDGYSISNQKAAYSVAGHTVAVVRVEDVFPVSYTHLTLPTKRIV